MKVKYIIVIKAFVLAIMLCTFVNAMGQTLPAPKREVRAVWLTTLKNLDWPRTLATDKSSVERQKQELRNILDKYQEANINTVLLQTVVRASTIYPSSIEPWDACMTGRFGKSPGYDPLAFAIEECHKRGMELQAWIVTLPVGQYNGPAAKRLRSQGYKMFKLDGDAFLDPSSPKTGDLVAALAREITIHYDVDGIHLDYIRYPEMLPVPKNEYISQWRRGKITDIVRKVHDAVKTEKPYVKISCSPIGKYSDLTRYSSNNWNARDRVSQDAQQWLRLGFMDQLYPMIYFRGNNFYPFAADWAENSYGRAVAAGLGTYFLDPKEGGKYGWRLDDMKREMVVSRWLGLGTAHFRSRYFINNYQGIYDFSSLAYAPYPALVPAMTESHVGKLSKPDSIRISNGILRIYDTSNACQNLIYYNVYASDSWPVDISNPKNLILPRHTENSIWLPQRTTWQPRYFAVTAMDRYGNESEAVQSWQKPKPLKDELECDGNSINVPTEIFIQASATQSNLIITNGEGQTVRRYRCRGFNYEGCGNYNKYTKIDVSSLPEGFYILSISTRYNKKKNKMARLGFFLIKK